MPLIILKAMHKHVTFFWPTLDQLSRYYWPQVALIHPDTTRAYSLKPSAHFWDKRAHLRDPRTHFGDHKTPFGDFGDSRIHFWDPRMHCGGPMAQFGGT